MILISFVCTQSLEAKTGKGMATAAKVVGGVLIGVGIYTTVKGFIQFITPANEAGVPCAVPVPKTGLTPCEIKGLTKMGLGLLETAGGAAAMMVNADSESQLDSGTTAGAGLPGMEGYAGGGGPGQPTLPDLCASMPQACRVDPNTNRPTLALPPKADMKAAITKAFNGQAVDPSGLTLDQALSDLDEKYDKAADAVAAFNNASNAGAFDAAMNGEDLGTTAQGDGDAADGEGLTKGRALAGASGASPDILTLPNGQSMDWNALLNKTKAERGAPKGANAIGLNLQDAKSGRILTLWERVSRAIRGTRDRDILLAKVEWTRQQVLAKQGKKKPNFAVSTEKN